MALSLTIISQLINEMFNESISFPSDAVAERQTTRVAEVTGSIPVKGRGFFHDRRIIGRPDEPPENGHNC